MDKIGHHDRLKAIAATAEFKRTAWALRLTWRIGTEGGNFHASVEATGGDRAESLVLSDYEHVGPVMQYLADLVREREPRL